MKSLLIVGIGTPNFLTYAAENAVKSAKSLYFQTGEDFASKVLLKRYPSAKTMDDLYESSEDFDTLNARIANRLILEETGESAVYAVPGSGIEGTDQLAVIAKLAAEHGVCVRRISGVGFGEAALSLYEPQKVPAAVVRAGDLASYRFDPDRALAVEEIDTSIRAGEVKLTLMEHYPDELPATLFFLDENGEYRSRTFPLYELDYQKEFSASAVLVLPGTELTTRQKHDVSDLIEVLKTLRAPGGCPWDAEQTHFSLKSSLVEETYEVLDAIDREDDDALCEELGDVLLQVAFHAVLASERAAFTPLDVSSGIVNKLIYRHPHVYRDTVANTSQDVLVNWENLKKEEKHFETQSEVMNAVPKGFPALMRAHKVQKKAAHVGFDWDNPFDALQKVREEADEVTEALSGNGCVREEIGDLLFAAVNAARLSHVEAEPALQEATDKFVRRFTKMEEIILASGRRLTDMTLPEMDKVWEQVKTLEKADENRGKSL